MYRKALFGMMLATGVMGVALAQTTPDAQGQAAVQALNAQSATAAQQQAATAGMPTPAAQAQYDADRAAYMAALIRRDASIDRSDARYLRQQRAYADAMAVWRVQVQACKQGNRKACDLPAPDPANFY